MGHTALETLALTGTQRAVLRTLVYFDIFQHPLRAEELFRFLNGPCTNMKGMEAALDELVRDGLLELLDDHYRLKGSLASVAKRLEGEHRAQQRMATARRMSRLIGRFPFVRAVMLSGSMSKGVLAEDGDIDFFVITAPGRLWVARTLLIAFKKTVLLNSRRDFCVNYFVDTEHLAIEDHNLFTATEVMTLVPMCGAKVCAAFFAANSWAGEHLPNAGLPCLDQLPEGTTRTQRILERLLAGSAGEALDLWSMQLTKARWRRKFPAFDAQRFDLALRSRRYVSKHHPRNFQEKVLSAFGRGLEAFEQRTGLTVS
jgi:hypothetical protein